MNQKIPDLTLGEMEGVGKLNTFGARRSSGTESGQYQVDVTLLYRVESIDQARALNAMFPGIATEYQSSFGDESDGKRKREYVPSDQDVTLIMSHAEKGRVFFEGSAEVRNARFLVSAKASTVVVSLRLLHAKAEVGHLVMDYLGDDVAHEMVRKNRALPFPNQGEDDGVSDSGETDRDELALVPEVGNLIVVRTGEEGGETSFGVVRGVDAPEGAEAVIAYSDIGASENDTCLLGAVDNCVVICTPNGAKSDRSLRRVMKAYRDEAVKRDLEPSVRALTVAIATASGRGLIQQGENGWPITDAVILLAVGAEPSAAEAV